MFYLVEKQSENIIKEIEGKITKVSKNVIETYSENGTLLLVEQELLEEVTGFTSLEEILLNPTGFFSEYDEEIHIITVDKPKTLEQLKEIKIEEFQNIRDSKIEDNIKINDIEFVVKPKDRENIKETLEYRKYEEDAQKVENPDFVLKVDWIDANDNEIQLTLEELNNVITQYMLRKAKLFGEYNVILATIKGVENKEKLNTIKWEV